MNKILLCLPLLSLLASCATSPIPEGYSGPIATVRDTAYSETGYRAQFFYLSAIDDQRVKNILTATKSANNGRGFSLNTVPYQREIPAKTLTLTLEGRISYGAPIQEILNMGTVYTVEKKITVTPESNKQYVVKGTLTADKQEVWLEEVISGKRVE
jgi:hypothetical protein